MAFLDSSDFSEETLETMAGKAVGLAKMADPDGDHDLPGGSGEITGREIVSQRPSNISIDHIVARVMETERLALEYDPIIILSNGASYTDLFRKVTIANTKGLFSSYEETRYSLDVSVVAVREDHKKDGSDSCRRRGYRALRSPSRMAQRAGRLAISLVGGEPVPSQEVPVVFGPRAGRGLIGGLARAVNGKEVHLGNSFLANKLGEPIASQLVTIVDDGTRIQGVGSTPVDGEGVATQRKVVVERGILQNFLYDTYGARKAGAVSTGNGIRGSYKEVPDIGPTNFYLAKGDMPTEELFTDLEKALYVAETIGFGVNSTVGTYSAGAFGLWIENGKPVKPVAQVTIAGDLLDILGSIDAVGDDLEFDSRISCPSFRVSRMTVAGT
jgi:PmbA protein